MTIDWQITFIVIGIIVLVAFFIGRPKVEAEPEPGVGLEPGPGLEPGAGLEPWAGLEPGAEPEPEAGPEPGAGPEPIGSLSGSALVDRIQRTLGIGILVDSVELARPVTIQATFMFGQHTTPATVTGESEAEAWQELAKAAAAWRNADYQHLPMWWGGAG